jgi:hypothetical protein
MGLKAHLQFANSQITNADSKKQPIPWPHPTRDLHTQVTVSQLRFTLQEHRNGVCHYRAVFWVQVHGLCG